MLGLELRSDLQGTLEWQYFATPDRLGGTANQMRGMSIRWTREFYSEITTPQILDRHVFLGHIIIQRNLSLYKTLICSQDLA